MWLKYKIENYYLLEIFQVLLIEKIKIFKNIKYHFLLFEFEFKCKIKNRIKEMTQHQDKQD